MFIFHWRNLHECICFSWEILCLWLCLHMQLWTNSLTMTCYSQQDSPCNAEHLPKAACWMCRRIRVFNFLFPRSWFRRSEGPAGWQLSHWDMWEPPWGAWSLSAPSGSCGAAHGKHHSPAPSQWWFLSRFPANGTQLCQFNMPSTWI